MGREPEICSFLYLLHLFFPLYGASFLLHACHDLKLRITNMNPGYYIGSSVSGFLHNNQWIVLFMVYAKSIYL